MPLGREERWKQGREAVAAAVAVVIVGKARAFYSLRSRLSTLIKDL